MMRRVGVRVTPLRLKKILKRSPSYSIAYALSRKYLTLYERGQIRRKNLILNRLEKYQGMRP